MSEEWIASSYSKLVCYLSASLSAFNFIFSDIEIAERIWKEVLLLSNNPCYIRKLFINFYGQVLKVNMELKEYLRMVTRKKFANFKSWTSFITVQHIGNYISMALWLSWDECSFTMGLNIFETFKFWSSTWLIFSNSQFWIYVPEKKLCTSKLFSVYSIPHGSPIANTGKQNLYQEYLYKVYKFRSCREPRKVQIIKHWK